MYSTVKSRVQRAFSTNFRWDAGSVTGHIGPPHHQIGEGRNPEYGADEGHREQLLALGRSGVGQGEPHGDEQWRHQDVGESFPGSIWPGHAQWLWFIFDLLRLL